MSDPLNILVALASGQIFDQIQPIVARSNVKVTRVMSGRHALTLSDDTVFDLIIAQHPLPDLEFPEFFETLRAPESACSESPMLILTRDDRLDPVAALLDGVQTQACCVDAAPEQIQLALTELVGVAIRAKARLGVQLSARFDQGSIQRFCQTINVSEAGLLIRHRDPIPVKTKVVLALQLPEASEPVRATGEVVRHTDAGVEPVEGIAVRFLEFEDGDRERLAEFVSRHDQGLFPGTKN